jgi:hypothetical protein
LDEEDLAHLADDLADDLAMTTRRTHGEYSSTIMAASHRQETPPPPKLAKAYLVANGGGRLVGLTAARVLASHGATCVVLLDKDLSQVAEDADVAEEAELATADGEGGGGLKVHRVQCDVSDKAQVNRKTLKTPKP